MEKNFDKWNQRKKKLNNWDNKRQCHEGEVWVVSIGVNVGCEIDGKNNNFSRLVLVVKRCNKDTFIGVPLTKTKVASRWYIPSKIQNIEGSVNLSQIKLFDQKRLLRLVEKVDAKYLEDVLKSIREIFI